MYKIVFIDLDGTLLNSKKQTAEYDKKILKNILKNIKIVFASARSFNKIFPYIKEIGNVNESNYTIAFNGALLTNNTQTYKIVDCPIKNINLNHLLHWIKNNKITTAYAYGIYNKYHLQVNETINELIYKVVIVESEENIKNIRNIIPRIIKNNFDISESKPTKLQFVAKGINKSYTIKKLLKHLKIKKNEMIAIGNAENDISMLKMAKLGIAMGNSCNELKQIANVITDTNDNCGVGKILEKILL